MKYTLASAYADVEVYFIFYWFFHGVLGEIFCQDGHMAVLAVNVHHFKIDHLDAVFLDHVHDILYAFRHNITPVTS